ncbi:LysR family transcriptional regulator [Terrisporobacter petrolearius]|uniref:LysR family transcriptional regulator n=1 Tax=Terrisporobacter petrolearius TaxID=1460447 RepID=UPI001D168E32|nr:LysR family transcriptional regulator [Terrisporobacter petrolearius]MCC3865757.1 LysR family transcriptional regulator [Terrisporobacter petrolearius]
MNLNHLQYFVTLAREEHYTNAAQKLSITQPSLSNAISSLEKELGTYLFEKKGRNVVLTKYGKVFLEYAEKTLEILNQGVRKVKLLTSETSGIIDLGYIYTFGTKDISLLINSFLEEKKDKNFKFTFSDGNTSHIINGLKNEDYDVGFCSKIENEDDIEFTKVKEEELVLITPKNHPLSKYKEIDLKDTIDYKYIAFKKNSGLRPFIDNMFIEIGEKQNIIYEVEKDESLAGLVEGKFGIAIIPKIPILDHLDVNIIKIKNPKYNRNIYMAKLKNKYLSPAVNEFIKFVINKTN